jgi:hypothetical protein
MMPANLGELRPLLSKLADLNVTLPTLTRQAQEAIAVLQDESRFPMAYPDNLATLSPDALVAQVDRVTFARELDTARRNTRGDFTQRVADTMAADLNDHTDDIIDQLRPTFDKAAQAVLAAHAAGIRANHTPADIIKRDTETTGLVALWQQMDAAEKVLDDIAYTRLQLARAVGAPPAPDQASGAFCSSSGVWNTRPQARRWLVLCDHGGPRLNSTAETRAACARPQRAPLPQEGPPSLDQQTVRDILGTPGAVIR